MHFIAFYLKLYTLNSAECVEGESSRMNTKRKSINCKVSFSTFFRPIGVYMWRCGGGCVRTSERASEWMCGRAHISHEWESSRLCWLPEKLYQNLSFAYKANGYILFFHVISSNWTYNHHIRHCRRRSYMSYRNIWKSWKCVLFFLFCSCRFLLCSQRVERPS